MAVKWGSDLKPCPIYSIQVTSSVIDTIDNVLNLDDEVFREAVDQNAPTRILRSLEEQLTAPQKHEMNFTESRKNIEVKAVQVAQSNAVKGIGFASIVRNTSVGNTQIFNDPENIPISETDMSIVLPAEIIARFRVQGKLNRPLHISLYPLIKPNIWNLKHKCFVQIYKNSY